MRAVPRLCEFYPDICLATEEKARETPVRVTETSVRLRKTSVKVQYTYYQKHPHITKLSQTHTLQDNIKPPQYELKQNAYRKSNST
jgi:hypothetical protein